MLAIRQAEDRGLANLGWLKSRHTFSFGHYYDPKFMGFGPLRVINEDRVQPKQGFDTHGHKDMEIISYVLDGALEHKDTMGNSSIIRPGDVQRMSAGTGVRHREFNHSNDELVHFLQIWIIPEEDGLEPTYEQMHFSPEEKAGQLRLVGSQDGRNGSVTIHQDVDLYATCLTDEQTVIHEIGEGRKGWVHVARGTATVNDEQLYPGDGVAIDGQRSITLAGTSDTEILLFDMG